MLCISWKDYYISEMPAATSRNEGELENAKLFCPSLTKAVLNQIEEDDDEVESSLNINKEGIVARSLESSLMTLFLHHYGWNQATAWSWNPLKTWQSWNTGMRLVYDTNMAALLRSQFCHDYLRGILC